MKSFRLASVVTFVTLSLGCGAISAGQSAQDFGGSIGLRPSFYKCTDTSGGVTQALLGCNAKELTYQNARLSRAYKELVSKANTEGQAKIRDEESKWVTYRDYYCAPDVDGGTSADVDSGSCAVEETARQAAALESRPKQPSPLTQYDVKKIGLRPSYINCLGSNNTGVQELQRCIDMEYNFQDARLNKAYKGLLETVKKTAQSNLKGNERAWIAFRDSHCSLFSGDGQKKNIIANDCLVEETAKQAEDLENRLYLEDLKK